MTKNLPVILPSIVAAVLAVMLISAKMEIEELKHSAKAVPTEQSPASKTASVSEEPVEVVQTMEQEESVPVEETPAPEPAETSGRRMMKSIAKMMENPTMNKVMEASQRGSTGALYSDLIEYLNLSSEETSYFMDLLMFKQMKQVDLAMKMMGGGMSEEEQQKLMDEIKEAEKTVKTEMERFLNNADDFAEFEFYEKTMGERMMLSQMDHTLAGSDATLSDETYRELLGMMHDERSSYDFSSDLHDDKNMDMSPARFSKENIQNHVNDVRSLNEIMIAKAGSILTPGQLTAFKESLNAMAEMQAAQLEMAGQMFGGGEASTTP